MILFINLLFRLTKRLCQGLHLLFSIKIKYGGN
ncbi:hypothetical protein AGRO_2014 [Agrobacterium sp. ATCC 31749]|nr:hypothetical protein AGRO_2014 [Agrobacterium sp. ATCC 31749]